jgi:hypothetical protein
MRRVTGDRGSAIVEMAVLGVALFGLLVETVVLFGVLQRASLATSAAAREVGRVVVLADSDAHASERTAQVLAETARNHGLDAGGLDAHVSGAVARGARLRVEVATSVPLVHLPLVGPVWPSLSLPVEAEHVVRVDRYRSFG